MWFFKKSKQRREQHEAQLNICQATSSMQTEAIQPPTVPVTNDRILMVSNLTDQSVLADIAKNDKDRFVRFAAVDKLTDQIALADIAMHGNDMCAAVERFKSQVC